MPFLKINGTNLYYEVFGKERPEHAPVLLIHGSTQTGYSCWNKAAPYDLEMVEQPLSSPDPEPYRWLHDQLRSRNVTTPIFADESVKTPQDVARFAGAVDGIVVKLMKSGGLRETLRTINTARAHGMQIMLSCMIESSVGVTAAAHLAPLCDYLDLDGPLLIANDPFTGIRYEGANIFIPDVPGIGIFPSNL